MIFRHEHKGGVWIDIEQPTDEEIRKVSRELGINERVEAELLAPTPLPLVTGDADFMLLVLHFPTHDIEAETTKDQEVDFVVGRKFVLTVRYEVVAPLHHLRKLLETEQLVGGGTDFPTDTLLEILFAHLFSAVRDHTNHIATRLGHIERDMFNGRERETVREISNVSREFLHLEAALASQEEPLSRFFKALGARHFFDGTLAERSARILAERAQVARLIGTHRAVATELRETNAALLNATQNEIVKTLTVVTFIILPLELVVNIFGFDFVDAPFAHLPHEFWIVMAILLAIAGILTIFFARKRWIF